MRVYPCRLVLLILAGAILGALPALALKPSEILGKNWAAECKAEGGKKHSCCKKKADNCLDGCGASQTNAATQCRNQCSAAWSVCKKNMALVRHPWGDVTAPVRPDVATDPTPPPSRPGMHGVRPGIAEPGGVLSPVRPGRLNTSIVCCKIDSARYPHTTTYEQMPADKCRRDHYARRTIVPRRLCGVIRPE